jgi:hypothetical protein
MSPFYKERHMRVHWGTCKQQVHTLPAALDDGAWQGHDCKQQHIQTGLKGPHLVLLLLIPGQCRALLGLLAAAHIADVTAAATAGLRCCCCWCAAAAAAGTFASRLAVGAAVA